MISLLKRIDKQNVFLLLLFISAASFYMYYSSYVHSDYTEVSVYKLSSQGPLSISFKDQRVSTKVYSKEGLYWVSHSSDKGELNFLAGKNVENFLDIFRNLKSFKKVKIKEDGALKEFGLDPAQAQIQVSDLKDKIEIEVGARNYASNEIYVQLKGSSEVYLINSGFLHTLANPQVKLKLFTPFYFDFEDLESIEVKFYKEGSVVEKTLEHTEYNPMGELVWTKKGQSKESTLISTWVDALSKLQIVGYSTEPLVAGDSVEPILEIDFQKYSAKVDTLRIYKQKNQYYADTDKIKQPMELNTTRVLSLLASIDDL